MNNFWIRLRCFIMFLWTADIKHHHNMVELETEYWKKKEKARARR